MRKIWYVVAAAGITCVALFILVTNTTVITNDKFVYYVVIACCDLAVLIWLFLHNKLMRNLLLAIVGMSAFAFLLVPMYNVFCDVTGLNGKLDLSLKAATARGVDTSREVTVEFVVTKNRTMPWIFKPQHHSVVLHPGQLITTAYYAKNPTAATMFAQAIPSISPSRASKYFKKVECFCFNQQKLGPGESAHLGLRFYLDPDLPKDIQRVTLAYTIFNTTSQER